MRKPYFNKLQTCDAISSARVAFNTHMMLNVDNHEDNSLVVTSSGSLISDSSVAQTSEQLGLLTRISSKVFDVAVEFSSKLINVAVEFSGVIVGPSVLLGKLLLCSGKLRRAKGPYIVFAASS